MNEKETPATEAWLDQRIGPRRVVRRPVAKRKLADVLLAGQQLSNMAYNLQQRKTLDEAERASLKEGYTRWDKARKAVEP